MTTTNPTELERKEARKKRREDRQRKEAAAKVKRAEKAKAKRDAATANDLKLTSRTIEFISMLGEGGQYQYFWCKNGTDKFTEWFPVDNELPSLPANKYDCYVSVNPTDKKKSKFKRAEIDDIIASNTLFADFDVKDFGGSQDKTLEHIRSLPIRPSVIVNSGGGYHCYWLLEQIEVFENEDDRINFAKIQSAWVDYVGGDKSCKDLARALRVPGTLNYKYDPPHFVKFYRRNLKRLYNLDDLAEKCKDYIPEPKPVQESDGEYDLEEVEFALNKLPIKYATDYDNWLNAGFALYHSFGGSVKAFEVWDKWSKQAFNYDPDACKKQWEKYIKDTHHNPVSVKTVFYWADNECPGWRDEQRIEKARKNMQKIRKRLDARKKKGEERKSKREKNYVNRKPSHIEMAMDFIEGRDDIRFGLGSWRTYQNGVWNSVEDLEVEGEISQMVLDYQHNFGVSGASTTVSGVVREAKRNGVIPASEWDRYDNLLACRNGVMDLNTGELMPHRPDYYITAGLDYDYNSTAECPNWNRVLKSIEERIGSEGPAVISFLQEYCGYALTTQTHLEIALWLYGPPGSSKGTFMFGIEQAFSFLVGSFDLNNVEKNNFALGTLVGKRLVLDTDSDVSYIKDGGVLNKIISGETLTIEKKYKDAYDYEPICKVLWAMNRLPDVNTRHRGGVLRRVKIVEFPAFQGEKDPNLKKRLQDEKAGILNWCLEGLKRLQERGDFDIPSYVQSAIDAYASDSNPVARFAKETLVESDNPNEKLFNTLVYNKYKKWCEDNGHRPVATNKFVEEMKELGYEVGKARANKTCYYGIEIRSILDDNRNYPREFRGRRN